MRGTETAGEGTMYLLFDAEEEVCGKDGLVQCNWKERRKATETHSFRVPIRGSAEIKAQYGSRD
jgi:hypothetical protein